MNPIKPSLKSEVIPIVLCLLIIAASVYFFQNWPATIATHWNFNGEPDNFSPKTFGAFFFPALIIGIYLLMLLMPNVDPKKERYVQFSGSYHIMKNLIILALSIFYLATGIYNLGYKINIGVTTGTTIGIMMLIIGNYMGKLKLNYLIGIKSPWTLASENVWNKTHRLGGWLFMLFGLVLIAAPFLPAPLAFALFISTVFLLIFGTFGYSYLIYRQEKKQ